MLPLEEAQQRVLAPIQALDGEEVSLDEGLGRVLVEDVRARLDQPPADNSAMDGYALRWTDVSELKGGEPLVLKVAETIAAGGWSDRSLQPGEAARIMTGAPLPPGADLVVMREWTEAGAGESVRILRVGPGPGDNIRSAGEDVAAGEICVAAGRPLEAADLALLAAQGMTLLDCRRRPTVAILSTGDEIQQPGDPLPPGHIYCGNSHALAALVREAGGVPRLLGIARDEPESLREHFEQVGDADALVTIGGVSVGDFDFVKEVATGLGAEQHFWKVAMRPGKPNAYGTLQGVPWWGLPGNPVSSMVSFLQYVRPALLKMQGRDEIFLPTIEARLEHEIMSRKRFLFLYRGIVRFDPERGGYTVGSTGPQGSGIMSSMARANCLISVPEDVEHLPEGALVRVQLLPRTGPAQATSGLRRD